MFGYSLSKCPYILKHTPTHTSRAVLNAKNTVMNEIDITVAFMELKDSSEGENL